MNKNRCLLIIFCVLLLLFILLFSYKTTLYFIDLTPEQKETIGFLKGNILDSDKERASSLELSQAAQKLDLNYTSAELSHLNDVKKVMQGANYFFYGLLLVLTLMATYNRKNRGLLGRFFRCGGITILIFVLAILFFLLVDFNALFTLFHQIFFPQGNWLFAPDSLLIQTFPLSFFVSISSWIFIQAIIYGSLFILISYYWGYVPKIKRP